MLKKRYFTASAVLITVFMSAACQTADVNQYIGFTRVMHHSNPDVQTVYQVPEGWTRYEAEDAELFGTASKGIGAEHIYSNGDGIKSFTNNVAPDYFPDDWEDMNYVRFTVQVPEDGDYLVDVIVNGPNENTIVAKANYGYNQAYHIDFFPNIGGGNGGTSWNSIFAIRLKLGRLKAGASNYIYLANACVINANEDFPWMNIDCIDVKNTPEK